MIKTKNRSLLTRTLPSILLCLLLLLTAACARDGEDSGSEKEITAPDEVVRMAEHQIARHIETLEKRGVAFTAEGSASGQQMIHLTIEDSELTVLRELESRDVTRRMVSIDGYSSVSSAAIEVYEMSYKLRPKKTPQLDETGAVTLDAQGWMTFDSDVLLVLRADQRYIELAENTYSRQTYGDAWDYIEERSLGSSVSPDLLKTHENYVWQVGDVQLGLGMYDADTPLPLTLDFGESSPIQSEALDQGASSDQETSAAQGALSPRSAFRTGAYVMSYENGDFITEDVNYYEFNQPQAYTLLTYARDTGGYGSTKEGLKVGDTEDDLFAAFPDSSLLRYDGVEGDGWMKNDCVYVMTSAAGDDYYRVARFYMQKDRISAMELQLASENYLYGENTRWKDGYYVTAVNSQKDCRTVDEDFRCYKKLAGCSAYDVSLPKMKESLPGTDALNQRLQEDWAALRAAPDNQFKDLPTGFADPVIKVYYEEYQFGDIYEVCVFYSATSGLGSGFNFVTKRYVYDSAAAAPMTDDEFLTAMGYSREYVAARCTADCLEEEDRQTLELTYEDVQDLYYIDQDRRIRFMVNFYS